MTAPDSSVSAGIFGFLAFFFIGVALWLLMRSMSGKIQHIEYDRRDTEIREGTDESASGPAPGEPDRRSGENGDPVTDETGQAGKSDGPSEPGASGESGAPRE